MAVGNPPGEHHPRKAGVMSKFSGRNAAPNRRPVSAGRTATIPTTRTHEGGAAYKADARLDLFNLGLTNMVGESTFYESAAARDARFRELVDVVAAHDPEWIAGFLPWLRSDGNMRSASIVAAVEAARRWLADGRPGGRQLVDAVCQRADEPAEALGYWLQNYGRPIPKPIKRGIADAATRLYTQRAVYKYDTNSRKIRMGDVVALCRPTPRDEEQADLFAHLMERRHGYRSTDGVVAVPSMLNRLVASLEIDSVPEGERAHYIVAGSDLPEKLAAAGWTWERFASWVPNGMGAREWEAIIPNMGYMALLRNLRNFLNTGVSPSVLRAVGEKIADPVEVARGRQFPFRYWAAYREVDSLHLAGFLEDAANLSVNNIPVFRDRTLVMIDTSASMRNTLSNDGTVTRLEVAAMLGASAARRGDTVTCIYGTDVAKVEQPRDLLRAVEGMNELVGKVGHGTNTWGSVAAAVKEYGPFRRVFIVTDDRARDSYAGHGLQHLPADIYLWNVGGYQDVGMPTGPGRHIFAGFSDQCFKQVAALEAGRDAAWPWMAAR